MTCLFEFAQCQVAIFFRNKPRTQLAHNGLLKAFVIEFEFIVALKFADIQYDEFIGVFIEEKVKAFE
ncbi:hypothetical protein D9M71_822170 [compost metagenome]